MGHGPVKQVTLSQFAGKVREVIELAGCFDAFDNHFNAHAVSQAKDSGDNFQIMRALVDIFEETGQI